MLRDKIWTTYKCRMNAERRYRSYNLLSHLLTSYYSLLLIFLSIFSDQILSNHQLAQGLGIALSVAVFSLSLVLYGFHFSETADKHRECYLKLQGLYDGGNPPELAAKYDEIKHQYPNHSPRDYRDLIVETVLNGHSPVTRPGTAEKVSPTCWQYMDYLARKVSFVVIGYVIHLVWPIVAVRFLLAS
ncbi:MAG: SLATT domain-containing protein [Parvibaculum sedimenti]|uniref:SLATT domain-containing protein n=1 Tax=Parvibaculum sedimenti TaxID=2608632 RepID=UPI003BB5E3FE